MVKLVCTIHKAEVEGKLFSELSPSTFGGKMVRRPLAKICGDRYPAVE